MKDLIVSLVIKAQDQASKVWDALKDRVTRGSTEMSAAGAHAFELVGAEAAQATAQVSTLARAEDRLTIDAREVAQATTQAASAEAALNVDLQQGATAADHLGTELEQAAGAANRLRVSEDRLATGGGGARNINATAKAFDDATRGAGRFAGGLDMVKGALGALGLVITAQQLVMFARNAVNAADDLNSLHIQTGVAVEELQSLQLVAEQSGVHAEELSGIFTRLARRLEDLRRGEDSAVALFSAIGLKAADFKGLSLDESLVKIAQAFEKYGDGAGKADAQSDMLGRSGARLNEMFKTLASGGLKSAREELAKTGALMSQENVEAADQLNSKITLLTRSLEGIAARKTLDWLEDVAALSRQWGKDLDDVAAALDRMGVNTAHVRELWEFLNKTPAAIEQGLRAGEAQARRAGLAQPDGKPHGSTRSFGDDAKPGVEVKTPEKKDRDARDPLGDRIQLLIQATQHEQTRSQALAELARIEAQESAAVRAGSGTLEDRVRHLERLGAIEDARDALQAARVEQLGILAQSEATRADAVGQLEFIERGLTRQLERQRAAGEDLAKTWAKLEAVRKARGPAAAAQSPDVHPSVEAPTLPKIELPKVEIPDNLKVSGALENVAEQLRTGTGEAARFGAAIGDAFALMISGSATAGEAFRRSMGAAIADIAMRKGQYFLGEAIGEVAKAIASPVTAGQHLAAAAKYTAAAVAMFAIGGGAAAAASGGGGGGGGREGSERFQNNMAGAARGTAVVIWEGDKFDPRDPQQLARFNRMREEVGNRNMVIRQRGGRRNRS